MRTRPRDYSVTLESEIAPDAQAGQGITLAPPGLCVNPANRHAKKFGNIFRSDEYSLCVVQWTPSRSDFFGILGSQPVRSLREQLADQPESEGYKSISMLRVREAIQVKPL